MSQEKIEELRKELNDATNLYYTENKSLISDQEFDLKMKELETLEEQFPEYKSLESPTVRVGSDLSPEFEKIQHNVAMLSLDNAYNLEDISSFMSTMKSETGNEDLEFTGEVKMDGLSLSLHYMGGVLKKAVTRGDGKQGDDVTENARTIKDIPLEVGYPGPLEVRGEVYMLREVFNSINNSEKGVSFQNPRNAASGSLKTKNVKEVARRKLSFRAFDVATSIKRVNTTHQMISFLKEVGFTSINPAFNINSVDDFKEAIDKIEKVRGSLPFEIDGIVLKVKDYHHRKSLGNTSKHVRWACAYKFSAVQEKTKCYAITLQVGRTGRITPVAELEPVFLAGSTVKRASLHNFDEVVRLGIEVGDTVLIEKGGDVIPKVVGVDLTSRVGTTPVLFPTECPECGSPVHKGKDVDIYCENPSCPPQTQRWVEHFVSRNCMNIQNVGKSVIEKLINRGLVSHPLDLYDLEPIHFEDIEGMGSKSISRVMDNIHKSKSHLASQLIAALGIRHVGKGTSTRLAAYLGSWEKLLEVTHEELSSIEDVGDTVAESVVAWVQDNKEVIHKIIDKGIALEFPANKNIQGVLTGKTVVVTGTLSHMKREEVHTIIEENGGKVSKSISKKTSILVAGEKAGSKLEKANNLGIKILSEEEFLELVEWQR